MRGEYTVPDRIAEALACMVDSHLPAGPRSAPSESLRGHRAFSSVELAQLANVLHVDVHWLITGRRDPHRLIVAARHDFDHKTRRRDIPDRENNQRVLDDVALVYRQAFAGQTPTESSLPDTVGGIRAALGPDFVRQLADRVESMLDVDVIRLPEVSTA